VGANGRIDAVQRIGVDAVSVDRIALAVKRSGAGFLNKVYTQAELAYCAGNDERLAGRWAAKEAVIKCFDGTGICFPRRKIEVLPGPNGAPRARLLGDGRGAQVEVSITHHSRLAVATAHLEISDVTAMLPAPDAVVIPDRPKDAHKGTFGTAVVLAGSLGLTGAAYLCSTAAARTGAGLVRLLVADTIYPILAAKCTEVMATPVPEVAPGAVGHAAYDSILRQLASAQVGIIGPGLGRDSSTWRLVVDLALRAECPLVIDADGLNALAEAPRVKGKLTRNRVLTPHPGELARMTGKTAESINADRHRAARAAAKDWGAIVVLKGAHTLVAHPDGRVSEDPHEVPALASGGTGDVLSGIIGGLIAQGLDPYAAAVTGVYIHAAAGRRIAERLGDSGLLAGDLLSEIPLVMNVLRQGGL
jgi:NAD(P)H-hydrate epimerase